VSEDDAVLLAVDDGIATVTLNKPGTGNAMDLQLASGLHSALRHAANDERARIVLLTGNGRLFCGGGDLRAMHAAADRGAFLRGLVDSAHDAVRVLAALEKPVVAAVQGSAAGAGLSLALLSDLVIATPTTSFVTAYTAVGLTPDCGQSWLLPRIVGLGRALDLTLDPRKVTADEARTLGIVTQIVPEDSLLDRARDLAARLARGSAHALGQARALLRSGYGDGFDEHLDREAETIARMAARDATGALIGSFVAPKA
jgi:2-(1,2-epoxy-1,2-dihydrophenyl)acetyl-CoA isomerase